MAYNSDDFWAMHDAMNKASQQSRKNSNYNSDDFWRMHDQMRNASQQSQQQRQPVDSRYTRDSSQTTAAEIRAKLLGIPVEDIDPATGNVATGASQKYDRRTGTNTFVPNEKVESDPNRYTDWQTSQTATVPPPPPVPDMSGYVTQEAFDKAISSANKQQLSFEQLLTLFDKYKNPFQPENMATAPPKLPPYLSGVLRGDQSMIEYLRNRQEEEGQANFLANLIRQMLARTNGEIM